MQHIMFKLTLVIAVVLCLQTTLLTLGADDEFAEFDDSDSKYIQDSEPKISTKDKTRTPIQDKINSGDKLASVKDEHIESVSGKNDVVVEDTIEEEDKTKSNSKPDLKLVNAPLPRIYRWESYYIEIAFLLGSFLYFVNFFIGSQKNHTFAQQWYEQTRDLLKTQFSLVGGAPQLSDGAQKRDEDADPSITINKKQRGLIKSTESVYTLWNSGRVGMDGLLVEINLLKRQDLLSMALTLLKPTKDTLVLRFLLNQDGYENFVFCLAHKSQAPKLARDMVDINTFCPKRKPISQCGVDIDRLFVMSELSDVTSFILDQKTISFIKAYEQSVNYIHITDQFSTLRSEDALPAQKLANSKRMATFSFTFPRNATERTEFILFALSLLDRLRRFKLAKDSKQKSEKNRQKIADILQKTAFTQRQEAAQAKKEELRRLEKERIYNEDDPEKQRRWEKMEAKRELKKSKTRVKQLKVKSM